MTVFKTQHECFSYVADGNSIYLIDAKEKTEIRFIDGVLRAYIFGEWVFCPVNFENPRMFSC